MDAAGPWSQLHGNENRCVPSTQRPDLKVIHKTPANVLPDVCVCVFVAQSCLTVCNPMGGCSPPGSPVHVMFQARTLEWVANPFSGRFLINPAISPDSWDVVNGLNVWSSPGNAAD